MARILVVDDDPNMLDILEGVLHRGGHQVTTRNRSSDVVSMGLDQAFDLAIVDYQMPPPDGLELLRRLRDMQPRCLRVLMSGALELPVVIDAVNRGEVARVVEKPFRADIVLATIDDALAARRRIEQVLIGPQEDTREQAVMLEECFTGGHIRLALQPIVEADNSSVFAYECLLRSSHEKLVHPMAILNAAEKTERVHDLAAAVSERAAEWIDKLPNNARLFVNVHPLELCNRTLLKRRIARLRPVATRIVFEITERTYLLELESWASSVGMLAEHGFSIAVDDLGSGYNSLGVLAEIQPQFVKVDMGIVRGVDKDARKQRLIDLLGRFSKATGARLIAEGVETAAEAEALRGIGTDLLQGYFFGKPSLEVPKRA